MKARGENKGAPSSSWEWGWELWAGLSATPETSAPQRNQLTGARGDFTPSPKAAGDGGAPGVCSPLLPQICPAGRESLLQSG